MPELESSAHECTIEARTLEQASSKTRPLQLHGWMAVKVLEDCARSASCGNSSDWPWTAACTEPLFAPRGEGGYTIYTGGCGVAITSWHVDHRADRAFGTGGRL